MFKVTQSNQKLGTICAVNVPAIKTCRADAPCKKLCYANKGNFRYTQVMNCYENNLQTFLSNPFQAETDIVKQLPKEGFCRVHASGDFVNMEYFKMMIRIAKMCKGVKFMAFTKKYELVNQYIASGGIIPKNFKVIYSGWVGLEMVNPYNMPTAFVELKKEGDSRIKKTAIPCSEKCDTCYACWKIKKGQQVLFHQH